MLQGGILQYIQSSLSCHLSLRSSFCLFLSSCLRQVLLYFVKSAPLTVKNLIFDPCPSSLLFFRWRIRARVTQKTDIKSWSNSRGEGRLFSMNLLDESGEIRATGFTDVVDKFYAMLEINKV